LPLLFDTSVVVSSRPYDTREENNAFLIERLQQNGVRVDLVKSTAQGLSSLRHRRYGAVLSDMGRVEDNTDVPDAGMRLLNAVRESGIDVPVLFYTSPMAVRNLADQAMAEGARVITSSPTVLLDHLRSLRLL
jgi:DNA-binding NtrC family response regulator